MDQNRGNNCGLKTGILSAEKAAEYETRIEQIEQSAFPDPWSVRSIRDTLKESRYLNLGIWKDGILCGYLFFSYVLDEGEIVRIAVAPELRRQGGATCLVRALEQFCVEKQISRLMLDVRSSNIAAVSFYKAMKFEEDGRRKKFYTNPAEDAILMSRVIL